VDSMAATGKLQIVLSTRLNLERFSRFFLKDLVPRHFRPGTVRAHIKICAIFQPRSGVRW
jgi:hypothetical protein